MMTKPALKSNVLAVDLDGTLIKTELPLESFLFVLSSRPFHLIKIIIKKIKNRKPAFLKQELEKSSFFSLDLIPFSETFLSYLKKQKLEKGQKLVLCTGSVQAYADKIKKLLPGLFDEAWGSTLGCNLVGKRKAVFLTKLYGEKGFDYAGNSIVDLPIAPFARHFMLVNPSFLTLLFSKKYHIKRVFKDRLQLSGLWYHLGLPFWLLNSFVFAFVWIFAPGNNAGLSAAFMALNLFFSAFCVLFYMLRIFSDRKLKAEGLNQNRPRRYFLNLFAVGDLKLSFGIFLFILFLLSALIFTGFLIL